MNRFGSVRLFNLKGVKSGGVSTEGIPLPFDKSSLSIGPGEMSGGNIAKRHGRSQCDAAAGIVAAHDARRIVAGGVEPGNGRTVVGQHTRVLVALQSGKRAEVADHDPDGVERPLLERSHAGVRLVRGIAEPEIVGVGSLVEFRILAAARVLIEGCNGLLELDRIDANLRSEIADRLAAEQI